MQNESQNAPAGQNCGLGMSGEKCNNIFVYHHEDEQQRLEIIAHGVARDFGKDIDQPKTNQFVRKPHDYAEHRVFQVIVDAQI